MKGAALKIVILGASGGCVDILDTIIDINSASQKARYECLGFLDDNKALQGREVLGVKVLGGFASAREFPEDCYFVTGIGSPYNFWKKPAIISGLGLPPERFATIVHPTATISSTAKLGPGCIVHQHVAITTNARLGSHVLVLPNTVLSHDNRIGDHTIITAGATISGNVSVGDSCYIGANSAIRQDIVIGDTCIIGIGSVVIRDVPSNSVVVGNPARVLRPTRPSGCY